MNPNPSEHDLKNALLFLETFPIILNSELEKKDTESFAELMMIYEQKFKIVKLWVQA